MDSLITAPPKYPLFRAAIMESGQSSYGLRNALISSQNSSGPWQTLVQMLNCSGSDIEILSCARAANASLIKSIEEHNALDFRPVVDNLTQIYNASAARASGQIAKVPVYIGSNSQEGRVFTFGQNNLTAFLQNTFGSSPQIEQAIAQAYPITEGLTDYDVIAQIYTDLTFTCVRYSNRPLKLVREIRLTIISSHSPSTPPLRQPKTSPHGDTTSTPPSRTCSSSPTQASTTPPRSPSSSTPFPSSVLRPSSTR